MLEVIPPRVDVVEFVRADGGPVDATIAMAMTNPAVSPSLNPGTCRRSISGRLARPLTTDKAITANATVKGLPQPRPVHLGCVECRVDTTKKRDRWRGVTATTLASVSICENAISWVERWRCRLSA